MKMEPKQIAEFKTDQRQIIALNFNGDGSILAAVGYEPTVRRWSFDGKALTQLPSITGLHGWTTAVVFHQSRLFCSDSWGELRACDGEKTVWMNEAAHDGWIRQISVAPDGKTIATCGNDRFVRIWDSATGTKLAEHSHGEHVYAIGHHPTDQSIVFGDVRGQVELWDAGLKAQLRKFDASSIAMVWQMQDVGGLRFVRFIDGGKTLLAAGGIPTGGGNVTASTPSILFFDAASGKLTKTVKHGATKDGFIQALSQHPNGTLMAGCAGASGSGIVFLLDPTADKPFYENTKLPNVLSLALHPDGKHFIITSTNRDNIGANGISLLKDGSYANFTSPLHLFEV
jgi:WD40 repeat protein